MRVVVCGSRYCQERERIHQFLDDHHKEWGITLLIEGGSRGVDQYAGEWADSHGIAHVYCPAHWDYYGNQAGPIRNKTMLSLYPDYVLAFPGGRGTQNMISQANKHRIPVGVIDDDGCITYYKGN